jgi:hypothetical protein
MPYKMKVNQPNLAKEAPVAIMGLGEFMNGVVRDVSDEEASTFAALHARHVPTYDENGVRGEDEFVLGDLEQAFENDSTIVVTKVKAAPPQQTPPSTEGGDK